MKMCNFALVWMKVLMQNWFPNYKQLKEPHVGITST